MKRSTLSLSWNTWGCRSTGRPTARSTSDALAATPATSERLPSGGPASPPTEPAEPLLVNVDGRPHPYADRSVYLALATLSGQPASAFPVGLANDGLPIGLQAIGPYLEDFTPITFAGLAAAEMGGFVQPPVYA